MSFLLISDSYYPDRRSSGLIIRDIYKVLKKKYICKVLTLIETKNRSKNKDIHYIKTVNFRNKNFIIRAILTFIYILRMSLSIIKFKTKPKIIYIYYPSFFLLLLLPIIKIKFRKSKVFIHYQDHFPENAFDLKIIKNKFLFIFLKFIRNKLIDEKINLIVNSKNLKKNLQKIFKKNKIFFFHNWALCNGNYKKVKKYNQFNFVYAGNVGPAQDLNNILKIFANTEFNISLKIFGSGRYFYKLKHKYSKTKNIHFNEYLNDTQLANIYSKCHASIICLSLDNKTSFIPSKFYDYCKFELPIFSLIHKECDLNNIISDLNLGISINYCKSDMIINKNLGIFLKKYKFFCNNNKFYLFAKNKLLFTNFLINAYQNSN